MFSLHLLNLLGLVLYCRFQLVNWFESSFSRHLFFKELCLQGIVLLLWHSAYLRSWWSHLGWRCKWHLFLHWSIRLRFSTLTTFTTLICSLLVLARFAIIPKRKDAFLWVEIFLWLINRIHKADRCSYLVDLWCFIIVTHTRFFLSTLSDQSLLHHHFFLIEIKILFLLFLKLWVQLNNGLLCLIKLFLYLLFRLSVLF